MDDLQELQSRCNDDVPPKSPEELYNEYKRKVSKDANK